MSIEQLNDEDKKTMSSPKIEYQTKTAPWYAHSAMGVLYESKNAITLHNNVLVYREDPLLELTTAAVMITPETKMVMTFYDIHAKFVHGELKGSGMSWDYDQNILKINARVQSTYDPL